MRDEEMAFKDMIDEGKDIFAHTKEGDGGGIIKERLIDHSRLSKEYFDRIVEEKKLRPVLEKIFQVYFGKFWSEENREYAHNLLCDAVLMHDVGKVNPLFQQMKMGNESDTRKKYEEISGADHSILSAIIYIDQCVADIKENDDELKKKLKGLIVLNSYIISRHHSDLKNVEEYTVYFENRQKLIDELRGRGNDGYFKGLVTLKKGNVRNVAKWYRVATRNLTKEEEIAIYTYVRLAYSLLVASDYYSTTEFMTGLKIEDYGNINQLADFVGEYEDAGLVRGIRGYERGKYKGKSISDLGEMNDLRSELFLDVEKEAVEQLKDNIFFLEAPTGSGKSNMAMNISLKLATENRGKIFYIYPFNTLIEQNMNSLEKIFGEKSELMNCIAVVNSLTGINESQYMENGVGSEAEESENYCNKLLLDREFLNYPFVLSTSVTFFEMLFGTKQVDVFRFLQLANSVVVLDEIQSYRLEIWTEIIIFLQNYAKLLNIKVLIMSATLPDLTTLSGDAEAVVNLVGTEKRAEYFEHPIFKERVEISYELLEDSIAPDKLITQEKLIEHVARHSDEKKILIEFIKKRRAYDFFNALEELKTAGEIQETEILCMTGDDNLIDRKRILQRVSESRGSLILVATQVVEAGVDIDMDIGYKDISKLDSEEQFLGRINRSCLREGKVYLFDLDKAHEIYKKDIRTDKSLGVLEDGMREILASKDFGAYYDQVMRLIQQENKSFGPKGLENFFEYVKKGKYGEVAKWMKLIDDDDHKVSVVFNRTIEGLDGKKIRGDAVWTEYKELLKNRKMEYAERYVKLTMARSRLNYFIYQVPRNHNLAATEILGELLYIEGGDEYFLNGKLDMKKVVEGVTII